MGAWRVRCSPIRIRLVEAEGEGSAIPIEVTCSTCGKSYSVPDNRAGQTGKCTCGALMAVPGPASPPPAPAPPPAPPGSMVLDDGPDDGLQEEGVICPSCNIDTRPGRTCEFCGATLGALAAPPPPPVVGAVPPPSPMSVGGVYEAVSAESGRITWIEPASWIKNVIVIGVVWAIISGGLGVLVGLLTQNYMNLPTGMPGVTSMGASTALSIVLKVVVAAVGACISVLIFNLVAKWTKGFPLRFRQPARWQSGLRELTRVTPLSALKVGAILGAIIGLVGGIFLCLLFQPLDSLMQNRPTPPPGAPGPPVVNPFAGINMKRIGLIMLAAIPAYSIVSWSIAFLVWSAMYNALSSAWGGIKFEAGQNTD